MRNREGKTIINEQNENWEKWKILNREKEKLIKREIWETEMKKKDIYKEREIKSVWKTEEKENERGRGWDRDRHWVDF